MALSVIFAVRIALFASNIRIRPRAFMLGFPNRMGTFTQFAWFGGSLIEVVILVRSIQCKSFAKYSLFYAYIVFLLCMSLFFRAAYIAMPSLIFRVYLPLQAITSALGCGVILEIIRHVFAGHVSLKRFARRAAVMVFGMIYLEVAILAVLLLHRNPTVHQTRLEMDLRVAQAVGLMAIIYLTGHYGIELGRNMRGMILGFGVYVGVSLISLPLRVFLDVQFNSTWRIIQTSAYLAALLIWAVALWTYEPDAETGPRF